MISRYIEKFSDIIANQLSRIYVRFPQREEIDEKKRAFHLQYGFPCWFN